MNNNKMFAVSEAYALFLNDKKQIEQFSNLNRLLSCISDYREKFDFSKDTESIVDEFLSNIDHRDTIEHGIVKEIIKKRSRCQK